MMTVGYRIRRGGPPVVKDTSLTDAQGCPPASVLPIVPPRFNRTCKDRVHERGASVYTGQRSLIQAISQNASSYRLAVRNADSTRWSTGAG